MLLYKVICFRKMLKVVLERHHILKFQSLFTLKFYYLGGQTYETLSHISILVLIDAPSLEHQKNKRIRMALPYRVV